MSATVHSAGSNADMLRGQVDEFVGLFFYGTMLKSAREHPLTKSKFGMGGRGENVFGSQLDQEFATQVGKSSHNSLSEAIVRQLTGGKSSARPVASAKTGAAGVADAIGKNLDVTH